MPAGPTFEPIASTTLSGLAASITFSNVPQTYTDLRIVAVLQQDTSYNDTRINFNNSTSDYTGARFGIDAALSYYTSAPLSNTNGVWNNQNSVGAADGDGIWACSITDVFNYTNSYNKTAVTKTFCAVDNQSPQLGAFVWLNTSAITTVTVQYPPSVTRNFIAGSVVTLYGIKAA